MTQKISAIGKNDAFYDMRTEYIGKKGHLEISQEYEKNYYSGKFVFDEPIRIYNGTLTDSLFFFNVRVKEVKR